jgi:hypothetical protein
MAEASHDPVDHARTTRQHAGESMKNGANAPGLALLAAGVIATVVSLASVATGYDSVAVIAALIAVLGYVAGAVWLGSRTGECGQSSSSGLPSITRFGSNRRRVDRDSPSRVLGSPQACPVNGPVPVGTRCSSSDSCWSLAASPRSVPFSSRLGSI